MLGYEASLFSSPSRNEMDAACKNCIHFVSGRVDVFLRMRKHVGEG